MKIALAQINTTVGDLEGNVARCEAAVRSAQRDSADLVVLPELAVPGYPPRDILFDASFVEAVQAATADLARRTAGGPPTVVGSLSPSGITRPGHPGLYNVAMLLHAGEARLVAAKRLLPGYDIFFETRWFQPGPASEPIGVAGRRVGVLVCEDLWDEGYAVHPPAELRAAGAEILVSLNASPYHPGVMHKRLYHAQRTGLPTAFVNLSGANDELVFDGRSFALDGAGRVLAQLAGFREAVRVIDLEAEAAVVEIPPDSVAELYRALVVGVRDFVHKNDLQRAFVGLSGGIDSSLTAIIAAEALGADCVTGVAIPSRHTDPRSTACARELATALGIGFEVVELEALHSAAEETLGAGLDEDATLENVQARLRAMILMSFVNRHGGLLLNTSNKTELALGYATLYGDLAGGLCPIADLTKPEVYELARWIQSERGIIPHFTLARAPSAELRPGQVDPFDYPVVGPAMEQLVRENRSNAALRQSEHKRWQTGVVLKVSEKAFGSGRLIPITRR
ncbi:MAG: NAD(+) synthase [Anaerolineales bacterium]